MCCAGYDRLCGSLCAAWTHSGYLMALWILPEGSSSTTVPPVELRSKLACACSNGETTRGVVSPVEHRHVCCIAVLSPAALHLQQTEVWRLLTLRGYFSLSSLLLAQAGLHVSDWAYICAATRVIGTSDGTVTRGLRSQKPLPSQCESCCNSNVAASRSCIVGPAHWDAAGPQRPGSPLSRHCRKAQECSEAAGLKHAAAWQQ